jgi:glycosyltransferase involved in cell wall biosynthesis
MRGAKIERLLKGGRSLTAPLVDARPIVYDITRLVTRALNPTPNGIDRVDFALARHFLSRDSSRNAALICTALGPRLAPSGLALQSIAGVEAYWSEFNDPKDDPVYDELLSALDPNISPPPPKASRIKRFNLDILPENWRALRRWAFRLGRPIKEVPPNSIYVNASQFLLDKSWFLHWLDHRPDVKPLFFVHDLLPIEAPEFFRTGEPAQHLLRMRNIARYAAGIAVGSEAVAGSLRTFVTQSGRATPPLCIARLPVSPAFETPAIIDARLADTCYFVICGTIEPRKNHLMLLNIWRELACINKAKTPRLIIVGKRGWNNQNVLDLLERCKALHPYVHEVAGLSTPALRRLLAGARALLMPSFAEGFGLPVAEAMAAGAPVIASDIEVFHEIGANALDYIDPLDGLAWRDCIMDYAAPDSHRRAEAVGRLANLEARESVDFFSTVDDFIARL